MIVFTICLFKPVIANVYNRIIIERLGLLISIYTRDVQLRIKHQPSLQTVKDRESDG